MDQWQKSLSHLPKHCRANLSIKFYFSLKLNTSRSESSIMLKQSWNFWKINQAWSLYFNCLWNNLLSSIPPKKIQQRIVLTFMCTRVWFLYVSPASNPQTLRSTRPDYQNTHTHTLTYIHTRHLILHPPYPFVAAFYLLRLQLSIYSGHAFTNCLIKSRRELVLRQRRRLL